MNNQARRLRDNIGVTIFMCAFIAYICIYIGRILVYSENDFTLKLVREIDFT